MAKKYFWLKLKDDFFRQKEIKKLRKIAGGDTYTIIYLKMQLLSLKNEGRLYFEGLEDNFIEEIALEIDEEIENVKVTILFLMKYKMLEELSQDEFLMTHAAASIGSETQSAERVRKFREKKKQQFLPEKPLQCNTPVTTCNTEIDIEKEIEKDNIYVDIIDYLNLKTNKKYRATTGKTKRLIDARTKEGFTVEDFKKVIDIKSIKWINTDMQQYLRPETLFGTKFESYLNEYTIVTEENKSYKEKKQTFNKEEYLKRMGIE